MPGRSNDSICVSNLPRRVHRFTGKWESDPSGILVAFNGEVSALESIQPSSMVTVQGRIQQWKIISIMH